MTKPKNPASEALAGRPPTQGQADRLAWVAETEGPLVVTKARTVAFVPMAARGWVTITQKRGPIWVRTTPNNGRYHDLVYVIKLTPLGMSLYLRDKG